MTARFLEIPGCLMAVGILLAACSSWPPEASGSGRPRPAAPAIAIDGLPGRIDRAAASLARLRAGDGLRYRPAALHQAGTALDRARRELAGGLDDDAAVGLARVERMLDEVLTELAQRQTPASKPPALAARPQD
ncbi:hypothetical protein STAQ_09940 [Allostella sp. ATCC 35155]|nr:hypothetical protein STAQ_09940 [Stella sp. ATCC 35155]